MGYNTEFYGSMIITPPLDEALTVAFNEFAALRHDDGNAPGYWCGWRVTDDGTTLEWDGGEKFYDYEDWLVYMINRFISPFHSQVSGEIEWQGDEREDMGVLKASHYLGSTTIIRVHGISMIVDPVPTTTFTCTGYRPGVDPWPKVTIKELS